jgi:hypothetical protein
MGSFPESLRDDEDQTRADEMLSAAVAGHIYQPGGGGYSLSDTHVVLKRVLSIARECGADDGTAQALAGFGKRILDIVEPKLHPEGGAQ